MGETTPRTESGEGLFLDTSILIAGRYHKDATKARIRERMERADITVTGLVALQEYKRRVVGDMAYAHRLAQDPSETVSVADFLRRINDLPRGHQRKQKIVISLLSVALEELETTGPGWRDRVLWWLEDAIEDEMDDVEQSVGAVAQDSGCGLARLPYSMIRRRTGRKEWIAPTKECRDAPGCAVASLFAAHQADLEAIRGRLATMRSRTKELQAILDAMDILLRDPRPTEDDVRRLSPCLELGDLAIVLESLKCSRLYTKNRAEFAPLCQAVRRPYTVRPHSEREDDVDWDPPPSSDTCPQG